MENDAQSGTTCNYSTDERTSLSDLRSRLKIYGLCLFHHD